MQNSNKNNNLVAKMPAKGATPFQGKLNFEIQAQTEIDGVGMGVLTDGTPFLTGRGLAALCGVTHKQIQGIAYEWQMPSPTPRVLRLKEILQSRSIVLEHPYVAVKQKGLGDFHAYPDTLCLAVLEYYAFDAGINVKEAAKNNYRKLAGYALREFIYKQVGYDPLAQSPDAWKQFHDRVSMLHNSVPAGYFGVFHAIADLFVTLGQHGLHADSSFIPDISVGKAWSIFWKEIDRDARYGARITYPHDYPSYFPQAAAGTKEPWAYPEMALGEFSKWMRENYIGAGKLSRYVTNAAKAKKMPIEFAERAILAIESKAVPQRVTTRQ